MPSSLPTLAFVTPWYGPNLGGGAESLTQQTAERLAEAGYSVEILTTCIERFQADWGHNFHKAGTDKVNGITVRRFPVLPRNKAAFDALNWRLMNNLSIQPEEEQQFIDEMIRSPELIAYLVEQAENYLYFFIPYLFSSTYFGAKAIAERAVVIPCLHDEAYARMGIFRDVLSNVGGLVFNSEAEARLAESLLTPGEQEQIVIGMGIDVPPAGNATRFRNAFNIQEPFMLYVGRRETGKNVYLLIDYWLNYIAESGRDAKLVLVGPGKVDIPAAGKNSIIDLGFVTPSEKVDAFTAATIFCQPSVNESFSIVLLESWLAGTPALVHANCDVTREHVQRANGGLYFGHQLEFAMTADYLFDHPVEAATMAKQGHTYVLDNYRWDLIIEKYGQLITRMVAK